MAGFFSPAANGNGALDAIFATADQGAPLVVVSQETLAGLFMPQEPGKSLFAKPNAPVLKQLNERGIPTAEVKKAFAAVGNPKAARKAVKQGVPTGEEVSARFAREARLPRPPKVERIGFANRP